MAERANRVTAQMDIISTMCRLRNVDKVIIKNIVCLEKYGSLGCNEISMVTQRPARWAMEYDIEYNYVLKFYEVEMTLRPPRASKEVDRSNHGSVLAPSMMELTSECGWAIDWVIEQSVRYQ